MAQGIHQGVVHVRGMVPRPQVGIIRTYNFEKCGIINFPLSPSARRSYLFGDEDEDLDDPNAEVGDDDENDDEEDEEAAEDALAAGPPEEPLLPPPPRMEDDNLDNDQGARDDIGGANAAEGDGINNLGLGAAHQALLQREAPTGFQPYIKPTYFPLRVRNANDDFFNHFYIRPRSLIALRVIN